MDLTPHSRSDLIDDLALRAATADATRPQAEERL